MIIGLGNEDRGDDGIGVRVVRRIATLRPDLETRVLAGGGLSLLDAWAGKDEVVLVDVVQTGAPLGSVLRFDATEHPVPSRARASTHSLGIAEAIELARSLGKLPRKVVVIGIEGSRFELGSQPSRPVEEAFETAIRKTLQEAHCCSDPVET